MFSWYSYAFGLADDPLMFRKLMTCVFRACVGNYIFLLDDVIFGYLKGLFAHKRTKLVKWLHGHYLMLFLPTTCCVSLYTYGLWLSC